METHTINGRHADRTRDDILDFLQFAVKGIISADNLLAEIVKNLAFAREAKFFLAALDKQGFESSFEGANLLAHSGLCDIVDLRGLGKALGFREITENFQAIYLHKNME